MGHNSYYDHIDDHEQGNVLMAWEAVADKAVHAEGELVAMQVYDL